VGELVVSAHLGPSPVTFLDDLGDSPAIGLFALEHILDHHGCGEGRSDVEDLEVAGVTELAMSTHSCWMDGKGISCDSQRPAPMPVFPDLGGLVEDVQLRVLRREHVVHAGAQLRRLVGVRGCWGL